MFRSTRSQAELCTPKLPLFCLDSSAEAVIVLLARRVPFSFDTPESSLPMQGPSNDGRLCAPGAGRDIKGCHWRPRGK
jgi:hypothetical protein